MRYMEELLKQFNITKDEVIKILQDAILDTTDTNIMKLLNFSKIFNCHPTNAIKFFRKPWE
ncbi:MAG TPA: hypothetical protein VI911_08700 [Patescibacteria group bacterium]|nr:MAG: hypothetical protein UR43_C0005G0092 [candidate division TM6 bacterium GW2011_GWF2_33_332]HLD91075.1 hypothetical protein [Patescibacteria group bacterium]